MSQVSTTIDDIALVTSDEPTAPVPRRAAATLLHCLMPLPASYEFLPGRLLLDESFSISIEDPAEDSPDPRVESARARIVRRIESRTGLELKPVAPLTASAPTVVVRYSARSETIPVLGEDESYTLNVSGERAVVDAATTLGALRGLETLVQLLTWDRDGYCFPCVSIDDRPRFPWRGLLIDVCRHWMPLDLIKRNIDGMASVKLNVLHLHLTEDQGFRIECEAFPELHAKGSDGLFFTRDTMREIVTYAAERGIRVVPEFGMPGHVTSWLISHPELASSAGPFQLERKFGVFDASLDPTREEVYTFVDRFFDDMAQLFPDEYVHVGGDGHHGTHWKNSEAIQAFSATQGFADVKALQAYFNQRIMTLLRRHGKKAIGWQENLHPDLPADMMIQVWWGQTSMTETLTQGHPALMSFGYFLDHLHPASRMYGVDPLGSATDVIPPGAPPVLGGEACMWTEFVSQETVESRIWPRLAAVAERLWSPRTINDVDDMYRRLSRVSVLLEEHGLMHERNPGAMLRRLAGGRDDEIQPLLTFVNLLQPVRCLRPTTQTTPITRLVDASRLDSFAARRFSRNVHAFLDSGPTFAVNRDELHQDFSQWQAMRAALERTLDRSPILREVEPLVGDLTESAALGLEALSYLCSGLFPASEWTERAVTRLDAAAKRKAEMELAILPAIRLLAFAASELPALTSNGRKDWKARVVELASKLPDAS